MFKKILLVVFTLTGLISCTSLSTKIKEQHYYDWSPHIQRAVNNLTIIPGMNKLQVMAVTDVPENIVKKRTQFINNYTIIETWILYKSFGGYYFMDPGMSKIVIISFKNGIVDSVSF